VFEDIPWLVSQNLGKVRLVEVKECFFMGLRMISIINSTVSGDGYSLDSLLDRPSHRTILISAGGNGPSSPAQSDKSIFGMIGKFLTAVSN
jgi:hypothetical protein